MKPKAYQTKKIEWYDREFYIDEAVLIPRPETEFLTEEAIKYAKKIKSGTIYDIGTGSGVIAATMARHLPEADVIGTDISRPALKVAKKNGKGLKNLRFQKADLLPEGAKPDLIIANLPYVDKNWSWVDKNLAYEPEIALFAGEGGLAIYRRLLETTEKGIPTIVEIDPCQAEALSKMAKEYGRKTEKLTDYAYLITGLPKSSKSLAHKAMV